MSCPEENVLLDFIHGELDEETREAVEVHIDGCGICSQVLAELARFERDSDDSDDNDDNDDNDVPTQGPVSGSIDDDEPPKPIFGVRRLEQGSTLGRYVVLDQIGAGGMGVVYSAYDPRLDRKIALKLLMGRPGGSLPKEQAELRTRLQREAQAMARLSHSNVITVHDVGEVDGQLFLAMEFIDSGTLKDWMRDGPHPWREALDMFLAAGNGLAAAHAAGLVHRDFKPDNVLLGSDGRVLVTDFGLARPVAGRTDAFMSIPVAENVPVISAQLTMTGELVGTPAYMAPEQLAGKKSDALADQFSFCVALYEALHGERPFAGKLLGELIANVSSGTIKAAKRDVQVPRWLRKALLRGLQPSPEDRWGDMHELLAALRGDPSRQWRTLAAVGLPATVLAVGLYAWANDDDEPDKYCDDLQQHFSGVWDPPRREALRASFDRSDLPFAARSWETTEGYLDQYAERWTTLQGQSCRAGVEGTEPASVLALRMTCLERQRNRIRALVDVLADGDNAVLERAVGAAAQLPDPNECTDVQRSSTRQRGLDSDDSRKARQEFDSELARAVAFLDTARYVEAERLAADVAGRARQYHDVWAEAEATVSRAEAEDRLGHRDLAESHYHSAFSRAIEAGHAEVMVEVCIGLLWGSKAAADPDEAKRWVDNGEAALARLGDAPELQTRLFNAAGRALLEHGDLRNAETYLRKALKSAEKAFGPHHPVVAEPLSNFGQLFAQLGQFDTAEPIFARALQLAEREYGPEHPNVGVAAGNLGVARAQKGDLEGALELLTAALAVKESKLGPQHVDLAVPHRNIASVLHRLGRNDEALPHARQALASLEAGDDASASESLEEAHAVMAEITAGLDAPEEAIGHARRARELSRSRLGESHAGFARRSRDLASTLRRASRGEEAVGAAQDAVTIFRAGDEKAELGLALMELAAAETMAGRPPEDAVGHAKEALEVLGSTDAEPQTVAQARLALAEALRRDGADLERVRHHAAQAHRQLVDGGLEADAARAQALLDALPPA